MSTVTNSSLETAADLVRQLGDVPLERIRVQPPPGTATEEDLIAASDQKLDGALWELVDGTLVAKDVPGNPPAHPERPVYLSDLVHRLGDIPLERIRLVPPIGTATEEDLIRTKLCELIDGTIVRKAVGHVESRLGFFLGHLLQAFLDEHSLGYIAGADSLTWFGGQYREPDVSFVRWDDTPNGVVPPEAILRTVPALTVEAMGRGNTRREMELKREVYFAAGVELVWVIPFQRRTVEVWTSPSDHTALTEDDELDGGRVLPGFRLSIRDLFRRAIGEGRSGNRQESTEDDVNAS